MKNLSLIFLSFIIALSGCSTTQNGKTKTPKRVVPIAISIKAGNSHNLAFVNLDYYRLKVFDVLEDFQSVNLDLVEPDENPEVVLDLNIDNFTLWPRDEHITRRSISRVVQVGTDAAGKPVYQSVRAVIDIVQVQRRSNALFVANLTIKGKPPFKFQRSFGPRYNYATTYVDNIQGDPRAVDASIYASRAPAFEPREDDFLLELSNREMLRRLSDELRKYYDNK